MAVNDRGERMTSVRFRIFQDVNDERHRQEELKEAGRFKFSCADKEMTDSEKFLVLSEEVGEVARALLNDHLLASDSKRRELRAELIQIAAVCVAWVECLDHKGLERPKPPRK